MPRAVSRFARPGSPRVLARSEAASHLGRHMARGDPGAPSFHTGGGPRPRPDAPLCGLLRGGWLRWSRRALRGVIVDGACAPCLPERAVQVIESGESACGIE